MNDIILDLEDAEAIFQILEDAMQNERGDCQEEWSDYAHQINEALTFMMEAFEEQRTRKNK